MINQLFSKYDQAGKLMRNKLNQWFKQSESSPHIINIIGSSISIMQEQITKKNLEIDSPDILIQPQLPEVKMFDFDQAEKSINEGFNCTMKKIESIKNLV
jgi:predicted acylesterase/phospholipase RssA